MRHDGRANPNQLVLGPHAEADLVSLRTHLVEEHAARHRPDRRPRRRPAAHALGPLRAAQPGRTLGADHGLRAPRPRSALPRRHAGPHVHRRRARRPRRRLRARRRSWPARAGFDFVDVKHCHGYLGHELLSAWDRPGPLRRRDRAAPRSCGASSRASAATRPGWRSASACRPSTRCRSARTRAASARRKRDMASYRHAFGLLADPAAAPDLEPTPRLPARARGPRHPLGVRSPPAARTTTRTSSARRCSRRRTATCRPRIRWSASRGRSRRSRALKRDFPNLRLVGSGYTYLQEWLPHVGQAVVRAGAGRLRRPRPHGALLSRRCRPTSSPASRSTRKRHLPHLQRLHHRPAQRPGLGLLPARPVLQGAPGRGAAQGDQGRDAGMSAERSRGPDAGGGDGVRVAVRDRRPRPLRPAVLLRLHGQGLRLDAGRR